MSTKQDQPLSIGDYDRFITTEGLVIDAEVYVSLCHIRSVHSKPIWSLCIEDGTKAAFVAPVELCIYAERMKIH